MNGIAIFILIVLAFAGLILSVYRTRKYGADKDTWDKPRVPDWHKNATLYEVNIRQYTPEGTFAAFQEHLPRLKRMGIDILWLMPIHEVSRTNSKGELGSPYAVSDYTGVNPDFGTMKDFKRLLKAIHKAGMYCIIDWVPNHTGWDNIWITQHPDWYVKDAQGNITDPINRETGQPWGWTDVAALDFDNAEMRQGMIDAMKFWVKEIGIDGFRVDVAHGVPVDFWEECTDQLYAVKPLFMLAEAEVPALRNTGAFVADYAWEMHSVLNKIAQTQGVNQEATAQLVQGNILEGHGGHFERKLAWDIDETFGRKREVFHKGYPIHFTSNHDENSWSGTEFQRMGVGHKAFAVLTATFDGMPLIYSGQESAMQKQLKFFDKDEIPWGDFKYEDFYRTLFELKHRNQALWNGEHGGVRHKIFTGKDEYVFAFYREKNGDKVVVIINLSSAEQSFELQGNAHAGAFVDVFAQKEITLGGGEHLQFQPWQYKVLSNN